MWNIKVPDVPYRSLHFNFFALFCLLKVEILNFMSEEREEWVLPTNLVMSKLITHDGRSYICLLWSIISTEPVVNYSLPHSLTLTHTHSHSLTLSLAHKHTHTHTHTHTLTHTHTHTHTHSHTHLLSFRTQTLTHTYGCVLKCFAVWLLPS